MNMKTSKDYTLLALAIPFSIALLATFLPYRNASLNADIPVCEYDICPSKGHNQFKNK